MRASPLGALEAAVMEHLWARGSGDVKSVHTALKARRITLNTVQSTLRRLFDKQLLRREKVSHAHIYSPRLTQPEYHRQVLADVVGDVLRGGADAALSAFVDLAAEADEAHLRTLEQLIATRLQARSGGAT
jgi:predicted transcriptional regulator